jgi:hypothetical protein
MKQTAVEWLVRTLNENIEFIPLDKWDEIRDVVQQALAMEKEQIVEAHGNKKRMTPTVGNYLETYTGERYYKETYGGDK